MSKKDRAKKISYSHYSFFDKRCENNDRVKTLLKTRTIAVIKIGDFLTK